MEITMEFLITKHACIDGRIWFEEYTGLKDHINVIQALVDERRYFWADWLINKLMNGKQRGLYNSHANSHAPSWPQRIEYALFLLRNPDATA